MSVSKRHIKLALKLVVTATALTWIALKVHWHEIGDALGGLVKERPGTWLAVWIAFLAGHSVGVFKWRFNVNLGIKSRRARLGALDATQCYAAGMFANLCLPTIVGGDALKALLAAKITRRTEATVVGGVTERLIDTFALLVLIVVGALWSQSAMPGWAQSVVQVGAVIGFGGALLALPLVLRTKLARWPRKLRRTVGRAMVALRRLAHKPQRALLVLVLSLAIQSWFVVLNMQLGSAIGIDAPLAIWFFAVPMTKAITLAPLSVGGLGLREVTLAAFLTAMAGVADKQGVAASLLWQSIVISTGLVGGVLWFVLGYRRTAKTGAGHGSLLAVSRHG